MNLVIQLTFNLCTPFKYDIRCASLCGVDFVVTKKRREKRAQRKSYLKGVQRLQTTNLVVRGSWRSTTESLVEDRSQFVLLTQTFNLLVSEMILTRYNLLWPFVADRLALSLNHGEPAIWSHVNPLKSPS